MPFQRPTLTDLITRIFSDFVSRLNLPGALLRRSVVWAMSRVMAGAAHMLHGHLEYIAQESMPDTAVDNLTRWANIWGVTLKQAQFADGPILFTGTTEGATIDAGSVYKIGDIEYTTQADATISGGVASVEVKANLAGSDGNSAAGTVLTAVFPVAGVSNTATVDTAGITNGSNVETLDSLKARYLARIRQAPNGGSAADYVEWALEVPGVTRAWLKPLYLGIGTVVLFFVRDFDTPIIPDTNEVQAVQDYIDGVRPVTADFTALAPIPDAIDFAIAINPNTAAVRNAITAELTDFMQRESEPGGTLWHSRIDDAISGADGEFKHILTTPADNVVSAAGHMAVMGSIVFSALS